MDGVEGEVNGIVSACDACAKSDLVLGTVTDKRLYCLSFRERYSCLVVSWVESSIDYP